jgi:transposase
MQRKLFTLLTKANLPKGEALTMKKRLLKHWESLFRFIEQPEVLQPTNNLAEQTMRFVVRIRRQTQGSRSLWGRLWAGRIMSVLATCRKQKRSSFKFLHQAICAQYFKQDQPSLLPIS